jgi:hypothetical protein
MKINRTGCYRIVFLLKNIVVKIPNCTDGWMFFIFGLNANLRERRNRGNTNPLLCPILFSDPLGFFVVMPKCKELTDDEFIALDTMPFREQGYKIEYKANSFGWLNEKVVCFDYDN